MEKLQRDFLESLITAPSPAGYEQPVRQVYHAYTESFADDVRSDVHGNMIAVRNTDGNPRLMFAGHCDELGFQLDNSIRIVPKRSKISRRCPRVSIDTA